MNSLEKYAAKQLLIEKLAAVGAGLALMKGMGRAIGVGGGRGVKALGAGLKNTAGGAKAGWRGVDWKNLANRSAPLFRAGNRGGQFARRVTKVMASKPVLAAGSAAAGWEGKKAWDKHKVGPRLNAAVKAFKGVK